MIFNVADGCIRLPQAGGYMIQSEDLYGDRPYNVDRNDKRSKYELVVDWIKNKISTGEWPVDHKLPTQSQWRTRYGVSYGTLRGAYLQLKALGIIQGTHGEHVLVCESELNTNKWMPGRSVLPMPRQATIGKRVFTDPNVPPGRSLGV